MSLEYFKLIPRKDSLKNIKLEGGDKWRRRAIRADAIEDVESYFRDSIEDYLEENPERIVTDKWLNSQFEEDEELHQYIEDREKEMKDRPDTYVSIGFTMTRPAICSKHRISCPVGINLAGHMIEPFCNLELTIRNPQIDEVVPIIYSEGMEPEIKDTGKVYEYSLLDRENKRRRGDEVFRFSMEPYLRPDVIYNEITEQQAVFVRTDSANSFSFHDLWNNSVDPKLIAILSSILLQHLPNLQDLDFFEAILKAKKAEAIWKILPGDRLVCCEEVYLSPPL